MGTTSIRLPTDWTDTPTVGGAIGGYAFYDAAGGSIVPLLYKKKSQFPALCRRFILAVLAKGFRIAVIVATDPEIVNNKQVEVLFASSKKRNEQGRQRSKRLGQNVRRDSNVC